MAIIPPTLPYGSSELLKSLNVPLTKANQMDYWSFSALAELTSLGKYYLPNFDLKDKPVLDVGACCGETAWFFLQHGSRKVICIEADAARAKLIKQVNQDLAEVVVDAIKPHETTYKVPATLRHCRNETLSPATPSTCVLDSICGSLFCHDDHVMDSAVRG